MKQLASLNALPLAAAALMMFAAAGCGRDSVKVYHVDTNDTDTTLPPPAATASAMPSAMPAGMPVPDNSGQPPLKYALPADWNEKVPTEMRVASFGISENGRQADVSVIPLGGMAGGDSANVNRWRGQVGQKPIAEDELQKTAEKVEVAGQPTDLYDIAGTSPGSGGDERIIGTILHQDNTAWFFKMTGDSALVEKNKAAFVAFLKSVEFGGLAAPSTMDLSKLPPSHPAIPGMEMAGAQIPAPDAATIPTWTVPAGWQPGELAQFLVAKFVIKGGGGATAAVNVSQLAGDGGGQLANLNRWRRQLSLEPMESFEPPRVGPPGMDIPATGILTVDYTGTDAKTGKPARLVGSIVPLNGRTWFYKLMGDADVVSAQKDALIKFVQSAKYPAGQ
ncbi:MAG TPA: hypothetical protein VGI63_03165 [Verrucomicrobiae bacterium]|jgi:hypothetical protein